MTVWKTICTFCTLGPPNESSKLLSVGGTYLRRAPLGHGELVTPFPPPASAMQKCVDLHESWMWLHGLVVNQSKTELLAMNVPVGGNITVW